MKYIVLPIEKLNEIPQEALDELHLSPRTNSDNTEVIMKLVHYEELFPFIMTLPLLDDEVQEVTYPYPVYEGEQLTNLLETAEWNGDNTEL